MVFQSILMQNTNYGNIHTIVAYIGIVFFDLAILYSFQTLLQFFIFLLQNL